MRVAQLTCVYPPYGGGIGRVAARYARALGPEHEVTVFTPRYPGRRKPAATPGVVVKPLWPLMWWGNAAFMPQLNFHLKQFDVVHLHYPFFGAQELLTRLPPQVKLALTYHMVPQAGGVKGQVFKLLRHLVEPRLVARAALLIASSHDYLSQVAAPRGVETGRWQVLPLGVDERFMPGEPSQALRHTLKIYDSESVLLFVGSLDRAHEFKGLSVLLLALTHLKYPCHLVVVGQGNMRERYEAEARQLGLRRRVTFTGHVSDTELPSYFRLANALVLPSTSQAEAFGLVVLEAMAVGVPVVASNLPGVRSVVQHRATGLLVPPGDALALAAGIEELIEQPALAQEFGRRAAVLVDQEYRWESVGRRLRELYHTYLAV